MLYGWPIWTHLSACPVHSLSQLIMASSKKKIKFKWISCEVVTGDIRLVSWNGSHFVHSLSNDFMFFSLAWLKCNSLKQSIHWKLTNLIKSLKSISFSFDWALLQAATCSHSNSYYPVRKTEILYLEWYIMNYNSYDMLQIAICMVCINLWMSSSISHDML